MNKAVLHPEVQEFLRSNLNTDTSELILKGSPFKNITPRELATQLVALKKAQKKLPTWFQCSEILYPPGINLEQTSSEITARYKASLIEGNTLVDLTGGFGIDSFFFAESFEKVFHCEINPELSEIAAHNFKTLGNQNIQTYTGDSLEYLKSADEKLDWIFLDPARRDDYGGKVFRLKQCSPDVPAHFDLFFKKADNIFIKTSPLLDLKAGIEDLEHVAQIHIVAVNNEVKELLWLLKKDSTGDIFIKTMNFMAEEIQEFEGDWSRVSQDIPLSLPQEYIYEPNPAIMKSSLFSQLAKVTGTTKLHPNSHLFTSSEKVEFPGRSFRVLRTLPFNKKVLKKELTFKKANITTRNFPQSVEDLKKRLNIGDGGEHYLFFTTNLKDDKIVLVCEKF